MKKLDAIERLLSSPDTDERREAVLALKGKPSDISESDVIRLLLTAMKDPSWRVRKTAQDILIEEYEIGTYMNGLLSLLYIEDNAGARNSAIETLTRLDKLSTPYLIEAFNTPNADVRKFIIDVIGQFKDKRALPLMLHALKDEDENVRASAVEHLGTIGDASVVNALIEILDEGDLWTAYPAADALGRIGDRKALPALHRALQKKSLREPALRAIGGIGDPDSLKEVVSFIDDKSRIVAEEAIKTVEVLYRKGIPEEVIAQSLIDAFGDRAIELLLRYAWSERADVRVPAILLLGLLRDERALEPLLELSSETDFAEDVKKALVYIGKGRPEALLPLFQKESPPLKRFITEVAAEIGSFVYHKIFLELLNDPDGHVRGLAAKGLANMGAVDAVSSIMDLLEDEYVDVQESAIIALSKLKDGLDIEELIRGLSSKNPVLRKNIALLFGVVASESVVSELGFALKDEDPRVRASVVKTFSAIKTPESVKYLMVALTDENPDIRASAALSLGSLGDLQAVEPLILLLEDPDDRVRASAARALGMLGDKGAVPHLISILSDPNGFVVATAIDSLGRLGGELARDALIKMLQSSDKEIRRTAIMALSSYDAVEELIYPFLRDDDWATRVAAIEVLGNSKDKKIREELERLFDEDEDPAVRKTLERYLL